MVTLERLFTALVQLHEAARDRSGVDAR